MSDLEHIGRFELTNRELYFRAVTDITSLPVSYEVASRHFVAFLACDTTAIDLVTLRTLAQSLLRSGCVYFCAWGPGCERVHDIFDEECGADEPVIMTTWHADESLDDALWFFLCDAHPDDAYADTCRGGVAISVGSTDWELHVRRRLSDIESLKRDVLHEA